MNRFRTRLRNVRQSFRSLRHAVRHKAVALTVGRRPSSSCQIESLHEIASNHLNLRTPGTFVEVGAFDGESFSNTSWLADNGWRGVYVEPSALFSQRCRIRHCFNRVQVLNVAAGAEEGEVTLMQSGPLSTICTETSQEYGKLSWTKNLFNKHLELKPTRVRRLDTLLSESSVEAGFDLLVVDVEGYEESVFQGFDLSRWQPKMLIVELCDAHPDFSHNRSLVDSAATVRRSILAAGYNEIHRDPINTIFIRQAAEVRSQRACAA